MGDIFLNRLTFQGCLGSGSFGIVFAAQDTLTGQKCAVKFVSKDPNMSEKEQLDLERESTLSRQLPTHTNVVKVFDVVEKAFRAPELKELWNKRLEMTEQQHVIRHEIIGMAKRHERVTLICFQMEMCGTNLRHWLEDEFIRSMDSQDLQSVQFMILRDCTEGIKFLHQNKIIHRDIKPENIMFSLPSNEYAFPLKVGDFGLCRRSHSADTKTSALTAKVGSWDYMAPEVIHGEYGEQCDIYSFGLVAWEVVQLIPSKLRKQMFDALVIDCDYDVIRAHAAFTDIKESIQSMTMRRSKERMQSLDGFTLSYVTPRRAKPDKDPRPQAQQESCMSTLTFKEKIKRFEMESESGGGKGGHAGKKLESHNTFIATPGNKQTQLVKQNYVEKGISDIQTVGNNVMNPQNAELLHDLINGNCSTIILNPDADYRGQFKITRNNVKLQGQSGSRIVGAPEDYVLSVEGRNCTISGISFSGGVRIMGDDSVLERCDVDVKGSREMVGICVYGSNCFVSDVNVKTTSSTGLYIRGNTNTFSNITIMGCLTKICILLYGLNHKLTNVNTMGDELTLACDGAGFVIRDCKFHGRKRGSRAVVNAYGTQAYGVDFGTILTVGQPNHTAVSTTLRENIYLEGCTAKHLVIHFPQEAIRVEQKNCKFESTEHKSSTR